MDKCQHNQGDYQAEEINNNGRTQHHYRCNGCGIILRTS